METASQTLCLLLFPPAHQRFTTHADVRQAVAEFVNNYYLQTMAARHRGKKLIARRDLQPRKDI
jgi:hypothetical protein